MPVLGGFGYGSSGISKAVVSSSTANSITNVTVSGLPAKVYRFNTTGSITLSRDGLVDIICQGPGGAGSGENSSGGGAGGYVERLNVYLPAGSNLVQVGTGQPIGVQGNQQSSFIGPVVAVGGGNANWVNDRMPSGGGCGGAWGGKIETAAVGMIGQGLVVVSAGVTRGGNGGAYGGGGIAADSTGNTGGAGYDPGSSWGSPGVLGRGGNGASMTQNTGNGGNAGSAGMSGLVLVRVYD